MGFYLSYSCCVTTTHRAADQYHLHITAAAVHGAELYRRRWVRMGDVTWAFMRLKAGNNEHIDDLTNTCIVFYIVTRSPNVITLELYKFKKK